MEDQEEIHWQRQLQFLSYRGHNRNSCLWPKRVLLSIVQWCQFNKMGLDLTCNHFACSDFLQTVAPAHGRHCMAAATASGKGPTHDLEWCLNWSDFRGWPSAINVTCFKKCHKRGHGHDARKRQEITFVQRPRTRLHTWESCRHVEKFHLSACLDRLKWSLAAFSNAESHLHRLAVNQVEVDVWQITAALQLHFMTFLQLAAIFSTSPIHPKRNSKQGRLTNIPSAWCLVLMITAHWWSWCLWQIGLKLPRYHNHKIPS